LKITGILLLSMFVLSACGSGPDPAAGPSGNDSPASGQANENAATAGGEKDDAANDAQQDQPSSALSGYDVIAGNLHSPWAIAFAGNTIYVSEREGQIVQIDGDKINRSHVKLAKPVYQNGESGFMGFVLADDFASSRLAYAYHTYESDGQTFNRIVALQQSGGEWTETKALLEGIPGEMYHDGGRLAIGPDGMLYATTGDAQNEANAQNIESLAGKILRMTPQGEVPSDNPFPGSYVYTYGHRNPQGLAWNRDGVLFAAEHGPSGSPGGHDEINIIEPGRNYGWPDIIGNARKEGMETPLYNTGDDTLAPSGIAVNDAGELLVAALRGEQLVKFSSKGAMLDVLLEHEGRVRDVALQDGAVYVITNNTDGRGNPGEKDDRLLKLNDVRG
jgi:glucose/arabinose dehydrogenase